MIQEIIKFKLHIVNGLGAYEEVLTEEVDRELGGENEYTLDISMTD